MVPRRPGQSKERAISETDNARRSVGVKLSVVARQLSQCFDQRAEKIGLSRAKYGVIGAVARRPGATQRMIAEALAITEATAGRLIERLCADGYLERREDPDDRRAYRVHVAAVAGPVLARLGELAAALETEVFQGFDEDDLAMLDMLLEMMSRNIAKSRGKQPAPAAEASRDPLPSPPSGAGR
jgi:MarR family transcriptional regulator for hemolysin